MTSLPGADDLRTWIVGYISSVLDIEPEAISTSETFDTYGLDSAETVIMAGVMEEEFGLEIEPALFLDDPSVDGVVAALTRPRPEA